MFCVWLGLSTSCAAIYVSTAIAFRVMGQKTAYENPNIICPLLNTLNSLIYDQFRADWLNINRPLLLDTVFSTHMAGPPGRSVMTVYRTTKIIFNCGSQSRSVSPGPGSSKTDHHKPDKPRTRPTCRLYF